MGKPPREQVARLISLLLKNNYVSKQDIRQIAKESSPSAIKKWKDAVQEYVKGVSVKKALATLTAMSVSSLWLLLASTPNERIALV